MGDKARGDVAIQGLWKCSNTCILDICVADMDVKAYKGLSSRAVIDAVARVKKAKYLKACLDQQRTFVPLAYSVDGMAGIEARTFENRITSLLRARWGREYIDLEGFVRAKIAMAVVRSNTLLLRGAWLKRPKWTPFVDGAALEGFTGLHEL